jgi:hypothetical protein
MNALARLQNFARRMFSQDKPLAEPELLYRPREMTGFFAGLSEAQKRQALAYRGFDWSGGQEPPRRRVKPA